MRLRIQKNLAAMTAAFIMTAPALAQHGAHVHGEGRLSLAVETKEIEIEVTLPGADVVGFEHKAETAADKKAVAAALAKLKDGGALFKFPAEAGCKLEKAAAKLDGMAGEAHKAHAHKEQGHKEHGKKGHAHKDDHKDQAGHGEFKAHYHFDCANTGAATHVDVGLFKAFPSLKEIDAATITAKGQGAQALTAAAARLKF